MTFDFNDMSSGFPLSALPITPALSDDRYDSSASSHSGQQLDGNSFDDTLSPEHLNLEGYNFSNFTFQQATPDSGAGLGSSGAAMPDNFTTAAEFAKPALAPHASPGAQLDQTFTSSTLYDAMHVDEGYNGGYNGVPDEDFTLFGATGPAHTGVDMFPPLNAGSWGNFGGQFDMTNVPQLHHSGTSALDELFPELKGRR